MIDQLQQKRDGTMQENHLDEPEFTDDQLRAAVKGVGRDARKAAFAAGRPVFIIKGTSLVAINPTAPKKSLSRCARKGRPCHNRGMRCLPSPRSAVRKRPATRLPGERQAVSPGVSVGADEIMEP